MDKKQNTSLQRSEVTCAVKLSRFLLNKLKINRPPVTLVVVTTSSSTQLTENFKMSNSEMWLLEPIEKDQINSRVRGQAEQCKLKIRRQMIGSVSVDNSKSSSSL